MPEQDEYEISVRTHRQNTSDPWGIRCAILLGIHRTCPSSKKIETGRSSRPFVLVYADDALQMICAEILNAGFTMRVDLRPDTDLPGEWPMFIQAPNDLAQVLRPIFARARDDMMYPFSIWGFPYEQVAVANRTIDAFQALRMDGSLFDEIMALGGLRIAAFQSSLTLTLNCTDLIRGIAWVKNAMPGMKIPIEWAVDK